MREKLDQYLRKDIIFVFHFPGMKKVVNKENTSLKSQWEMIILSWQVTSGQ